MNYDELSAEISRLESELENINCEINDFDVSDYLDEDDFYEYVQYQEPEVVVMGVSLNPAEVLREVDPTAFDQECANWIDSHEPSDIDEYQDLISEKEALEEELEELVEELEELEDE